MRALIVGLSILSAITPARAQSPIAQTPSPAFEVASVKPNKSVDQRVVMVAEPNGRFMATNIKLPFLIRTANQLQVMIALATDWSPTGSDGILEELNYAAAWNATQSPRVFTDAEWVKMVTLNPATLARLQDKIGSLQPDHFADLLVVRS